MTPGGKDIYYPHFVAGETEAQKDVSGLPKAWKLDHSDTSPLTFSATFQSRDC